MRIPNKFNGYSADNIRLYNDPVTLTALTAAGAGTGTMAGTALLGTGAAAAGAASTIPTLAGAGALGSMSGGTLAAAAPSLAPVASSAGLGILPEATGILPQTLGGAQGIMQGAQAVVPEVAKAAGTELAQTAGTELTKALPVDQVSAMTPVAAPPVATPPPVAGQDVVAAAGNNAQFSNAAKTSFELGNPADPTKMPTQYGSPNPFADQAAASKAYYENAANQASNELNRNIADTTFKKYAQENAMKNGFDMAMEYANKNPLTVASGLYGAQKMGILGDDNVGGPPKDNYKSKFDSSKFRAGNDAPPVNQYAAAPNFYSKTYAEGGNVGAVEAMSNMNAVGNNSMYPMANIPRLDYANPMQQRPVSQNMMTMGGDVPTDPYTGMQKLAAGGISGFRKQLAKEEADRKAQGEALMEQVGSKVKGPGIFNYTLEQNTGRPDKTAMSMFEGAAKRAGVKVAEMPKANIPQDFTYAAANGGIMHGLGGYSDYAAGGRLLKGPGDGVSDSIPAVIGNKQPARLADGEFVVPARIVSELGNGSTEAGARQLYAMMERIQKGRRKSVGKGKVAVDSKSKKHLPA
jgi:hypothetical protein